MGACLSKDSGEKAKKKNEDAPSPSSSSPPSSSSRQGGSESSVKPSPQPAPTPAPAVPAPAPAPASAPVSPPPAQPSPSPSPSSSSSSPSPSSPSLPPSPSPSSPSPAPASSPSPSVTPRTAPLPPAHQAPPHTPQPFSAAEPSAHASPLPPSTPSHPPSTPSHPPSTPSSPPPSSPASSFKSSHPAAQNPDMAEQEAKLRQIFTQLDRDKSGTLDVSELKVILEKMGLRVDTENVLFLMSRYDDDHNGTLNFDEFSEMIMSIMNVKKQFEAVDRDRSGTISAAEMRVLMEKMELSADVSKQILHLFDEDRSGMVEYSEFVTLIFYLNELEFQYKAFKERVEDYLWLHALLGVENGHKAAAVARTLQELKKGKEPTFDEFVRPIVVAASGSLDPMGRPKAAPRIQTKRARVRPPPKKIFLKKHATQSLIGPGWKNDGSLYCDPDFPPSVNVLPVRLRHRVASWKRPSEMNSDAKLFVNGVDEADVIQGALGDCWFLGALAVVATSTENFIEYLFVQQKPDIGLYECRFFKNGNWISVVVDDRLPVDSSGRLILASCKDPSEFWVPIVEKAYAKLHGSYDAIESGSISDGLKDLTGEGVEVMRLDSDEMKANPALAWDTLLHNIRESFLMGCAIDDVQLQPETELQCGLLVSHAYSIIDCQEVEGAKLLRIRNPWGQREWNGAWSDNASEWTPALMKHFNYEFGNDGTFFMCFEDFIKFYSRVYVLRMLSDSVGEVWHKMCHVGDWMGERAAGCANNSGWLGNPQYSLQVTQPDTKIFVNLSQPDLRYVLKKNPALIDKDYEAIGLYIVKTKDVRYRKTSCLPEEKVATSTFTNVRDLSFEHTCQPGTYMLIPCTFAPRIETRYDLCLYASRPAEINHLNEEMPCVKVNGAWQGASAGGCANNRETWLNNPQFLLVCSTPGTVEILLSQQSVPNQPLEAIALYAFQTTGPSRLSQPTQILLRPSSIINLQTVSETIVVEANVNYIIMPTTFEAQKERNFSLSVASDTANVSIFKAL